MLKAHNVCLEVDGPGDSEANASLHLLREVSFEVPPAHLVAIVGPSGCGKTTLLKVVTGILQQTDGELLWDGRNLSEEEDLHPGDLGYVPQFSIAYDLLTVEESIASAMALRTQLAQTDDFLASLDYILEITGLTHLAERQVKVLSGGQKRRLGLALELVTDPCLLLCDEVTSGLDPKSEREITDLLRVLSRGHPKRVVINVTHSLASLDAYDSVMVMYQGVLTYHGPPHSMTHYFGVEHPEEVYLKLTERSNGDWHESWEKYRETYYKRHGFDGTRVLPEDENAAVPADGPSRTTVREKRTVVSHEALPKPHVDVIPEHHEFPPIEMPSMVLQLIELLKRRWTIFRRDKAQVWLHLAMLFGFPLLVVIFALDGIKPLRSLSTHQEDNIEVEYRQQQQFASEQLKAGGLVSGLVMLQVVLVTLMASNNAAREIASERLIMEREKLGGLHPFAYVGSKVIFLGLFVLGQSLWMGFFVDLVVGGLPGDLIIKLALLVLASAAMTSVCLGISALSRSPEKSTILCIYLVGFQLPLSGAVLTLPDWLENWVQPFIAAFWSWSGSLSSMRSTAFFDAVKRVTDTDLVTPGIAAFVLFVHVVVGLAMAFIGVQKSQWDS
ncbi:MAG: ATP-binding cassette domain-containing protein [Prosthecobacter sp.]|jgi:ABC-type multidrug transport system ATPase subunit|uniref:ATP-binding cassette domain-containing protein n=1 Tax=Prosthecobacter sp. TaxID=1965333 RepID=UPI0019F69AB1|nr:ATP-binding cassette domain-containing protein [Prosthecobacter sp.]MBE2283775.1 ATP-binding cassette domain-containing protein [Prosthecobacter sp.]